MITKPRIPAIQADNGFMTLHEILELTHISPHAWCYGSVTGRYPQPTKRGIKGDLWRVIDVRALLTKLK